MSKCGEQLPQIEQVERYPKHRCDKPDIHAPVGLFRVVLSYHDIRDNRSNYATEDRQNIPPPASGFRIHRLTVIADLFNMFALMGCGLLSKNHVA